MDCSWPLGASLNDGISKFEYMNEQVTLEYPSIDDLVRCIFELNRREPEKQIFLYKEDLDWAFRQLGVEFSSIPLLGFRWRNLYYFDVVMVMGCRIAPYICQRTTNMVAYLHRQMSYFLLNYIDDFVGTEYEEKVYRAHATFVWLLRDIGLKRSVKKSVVPTQVLEFIGNLVDAKNVTIGVTDERKAEVGTELSKWERKSFTMRREVESLVGKLQFISNVVKPGQLFVSRLLAELKTMEWGKRYKLSWQCKKDVLWWKSFLPTFQGTGILWLLDVPEIDAEFAVDACLKGAGGVRDTEFFRIQFPPSLTRQNLDITHYELWAVILAVRLWGPKLTGKIVRIRSDNEAVATIINSGRSRDGRLQSQLRELVWWLVHFQCKVKSVHIFGQKNKLPDLLSRWGEGPHIEREFDALTEGRSMTKGDVLLQWFKFQHPW